LGIVLLAVVGALRLNTSADNTVVMYMLASVVVYSVLLWRHLGRTVSGRVLPYALFMIALALLLMTSLRGWGVTGHDIHREFFVFQLAKDMGYWSTAYFADAYNACLSITLLPTLLSTVLHIPDVYVFKVLFQLMFAMSIVTTFLLNRKWLSAPYAFLATLLVMSFPTFFQDMPFLGRQEVAFLFFALMVYYLFEERLALWVRRTLFVVMGIGVILSHYSTTYTIMLVFLLVSVAMPLVVWLLVRVRRVHHIFSRSALAGVVSQVTQSLRRITLGMVVLLIAAALAWTSGITKTDSHARSVLGDVWTAMREGFDGGSRSVDVLVLFSFSRVETDHTLEEYVETVVNPRRNLSPGEYYATSTYSVYPLVTLPLTTLAVTPFGSKTLVGPVSFGDAVTFVGRLLTKIMQLAIVLGLGYVLLRRGFLKRFDTEYYAIAASSLFFVALCVVVPLLSKEYGVFRALQQSMFVLSTFMMVGVLLLGRWCARLFVWWTKLLHVEGTHRKTAYRTYMDGTAVVLVTMFFLYATGFMAQLVGGNLPTLHLNSVGDDYKHYVTESREMEAILWLQKELEAEAAETGVQPFVHGDRYVEKKLGAHIRRGISGDMFPGSIHKDAYVFVGPAILHGGTAAINFDGTLIKYAYPIEFLEEHKNRVYDNGDVRIYR
jgi:uncharacterized membrane protein